MDRNYWQELEEEYTMKTGIPINHVPPCNHQFFHVADISHSPMGSMVIDGRKQMVMEPYKQGTLVMCAVCGEQRQLWQDGTIMFFIDGNWQKAVKENT